MFAENIRSWHNSVYVYVFSREIVVNRKLILSFYFNTSFSYFAEIIYSPFKNQITSKINATLAYYISKINSIYKIENSPFIKSESERLECMLDEKGCIIFTSSYVMIYFVSENIAVENHQYKKSRSIPSSSNSRKVWRNEKKQRVLKLQCKAVTAGCSKCIHRNTPNII